MSVLERLHSAYNRHDARAAVVLYTADGEHEDVAGGAPRRGREAIAEGLHRFLRSVPDAHWETIDIVAEGDREVARYVLTGTLRGDMGPFRATGQRIALRGVHVLDLEAGAIARCEDYWDAATFARQVGADPPAPQPHEETQP